MPTIIKENQITDILEKAAQKGARPITVTIVTTKSLLKKGRDTNTAQPFGNIRRLSTVNGLINFDFSKSVNRDREKKGQVPDFTAQSATYTYDFDGKSHRAIVANKNHPEHRFLKLRVNKRLASTMIDPQDQVVDPATISEFLPIHVDNPVPMLTVSLGNIKSFKIDSEQYLVQN